MRRSRRSSAGVVKNVYIGARKDDVETNVVSQQVLPEVKL